MRNDFTPKGAEDVLEGLELVLEAVEETLNEFGTYVGEVFAESDRETLEKLLRRKFDTEDFRDTVRDLKRRWSQMWNGQKSGRRRRRKLPKGLRTPQEHFVRPLLETLVELGGKGEAGKVTDLVGAKMEQELNEYDLEPLPSTNQPRWRNTVQWCRLDLVREGYLSPDSPRGVWEITDKGREYLKKLQ